MHLPLKFHHPTFTCSEVTVLTNTQTNKQTPLKTSNALCYATTLGNHLIITYHTPRHRRACHTGLSAKLLVTNIQACQQNLQYTNSYDFKLPYSKLNHILLHQQLCKHMAPFCKYYFQNISNVI